MSNQISLPYAIIEAYSVVRVKIIGNLDPIDLRTLRDEGFTHDRGQWFKTYRRTPVGVISEEFPEALAGTQTDVYLKPVASRIAA